MSFVVRKHNFKPDGRYIEKDGRSWLVTNVTMNNAGQVILHLNDPIRYDNELYKIDTLDDLLKKYDL
jgi:hypothetical protein